MSLLSSRKLIVRNSLNILRTNIVLRRPKMTSSINEDISNNAKSIFLHSLHAVCPRALIRKFLKVESSSLSIKDKSYKLEKNLYLIGFGKAVLGMAAEVAQLTCNHLQHGILSVPLGALRTLSLEDQRCVQQSNVRVYEGAENNLPDKRAHQAALEVHKMIETLNENHLLLVLISGGGSALLPLPVVPITLQEKIEVIQRLAEAGASITELNTVRKKLSVLKGGGLATLAAPAQTVSLILSDVIGNPIDFIASGPTVENKEDEKAGLRIIQKYQLLNAIPINVREVLKSGTGKSKNVILPHPENIIIGDNKIALSAAANEARRLGYFPLILSNSLQGDVVDVCSFYTTLIKLLEQVFVQKIGVCELVSILDNQVDLMTVCPTFELEERDIYDCIMAINQSTGVCIIAGGEPTVKVRGTGKGGRNQELSMRMSIALHDLGLKSIQVCFLSAGTDGIDGPTDAAGAIAYPAIIHEASLQGLDMKHSLNLNDSYTFYSKLQNGKNLIYTGHTGTNVMDVHLILIQKSMEAL